MKVKDVEEERVMMESDWRERYEILLEKYHELESLTLPVANNHHNNYSNGMDNMQHAQEQENVVPNRSISPMTSGNSVAASVSNHSTTVPPQQTLSKDDPMEHPYVYNFPADQSIALQTNYLAHPETSQHQYHTQSHDHLLHGEDGFDLLTLASMGNHPLPSNQSNINNNSASSDVYHPTTNQYSNNNKPPPAWVERLQQQFANNLSPLAAAQISSELDSYSYTPGLSPAPATPGGWTPNNLALLRSQFGQGQSSSNKMNSDLRPSMTNNNNNNNNNTLPPSSAPPSSYPYNNVINTLHNHPLRNSLRAEVKQQPTVNAFAAAPSTPYNNSSNLVSRMNINASGKRSNTVDPSRSRLATSSSPIRGQQRAPSPNRFMQTTDSWTKKAILNDIKPNRAVPELSLRAPNWR